MIFLPPFLYKFWSGKYPLATSFWGFGLLGWWVGLFGIGILMIPLHLLHVVALRGAIEYILIIFYTAFLMIGIWRSASIYAREHPGTLWPFWAKLMVFVFAGVFLQGLFTKGGAGRLMSAFLSS